MASPRRRATRRPSPRRTPRNDVRRWRTWLVGLDRGRVAQSSMATRLSKRISGSSRSVRGLVVAVVVAVGDEQRPDAGPLLALEDLRVALVEPAAHPDLHLRVGVAVHEVEAPRGVRGRTGVGADHDASPLGVEPERQRDLVLVARLAADGVEDDVVHAGDDPGRLVVGRLQPRRVLAGDARDLVARGFLEGLVLLVGRDVAHGPDCRRGARRPVRLEPACSRWARNDTASRPTGSGGVEEGHADEGRPGDRHERSGGHERAGPRAGGHRAPTGCSASRTPTTCSSPW